MKKAVLILSVFLIVTLVTGLNGRAADKPAPAGFGQSYDEIVALAKKEGVVRYASSDPDSKDRDRFFGSFEKKYGIKVDYDRARGSASRERILLEIIGGQGVYDLLHISKELVPRYHEAGALAGPFQWQSLFGTDPSVISPDKYVVAGGGSSYGIVYNKDLVPEDRIPRNWEDFLDPWWKGKFVLDTRPRTFSTLSFSWGEAKTLDYARALLANKPVFKRGQTEVIAEVAAGEYPAFNGCYISSALRLLRRDPTARMGLVLPKELPSDHYATLAVLTSAKSPNAALLLAGWLVSDEGQMLYDEIIHRGSPEIKGTKMAKMVEEAGATVMHVGWDASVEQKSAISKKIVEAWGFPVRKQKKKKK